MLPPINNTLFGGEGGFIALLMDKLPYSVFIKDTDLNYAFCNENFASGLNIKPAEIAGKTDFDFFPRELAEAFRKNDKKVLLSGIPEEIEEKILLAEQIKYVNTSKIPIMDADKNIKGLLCILRDITDKKDQELRIVRLNRFYKYISEINKAIVKAENNKILFDEVCRISVTFGNFKFAWIGLVDEETHRIKPIAHFGNGENYLEFIQQQHTGNENFNRISKELTAKKYFICNDVRKELGNYTWANKALERNYLSLAVFSINMGNKIIGQFNLYSSDINFFNVEEVNLLLDVTTEISHNILIIVNRNRQKSAEEIIRKSEEQFRAVWDKSFDAMNLVDKDGKILMVNNAFCELFKKDKQELEGEYVHTLYWKKDKEILTSFRDDFNNRTIEPGVEEEITIWNREKIWVDISQTFIDLENETMLFSIYRNISERKKAEEELLVAKELAEESSRLKSSLLGNMSHELRTPLNGILGFTQILLDEISEPFHFAMINKIKVSGQRLMATLNSVLSLSELESGMAELSVSEIKINTTIRYLSQAYIQMAAEKGLSFIIKDWKDELSVLADDKLFEQIFANVVDNAIKYTEKGGITIEIRPDMNDRGDFFALVKITDTGIGIAKDQIEYIFDEFRQASEGFNRNFEGNGLGLTLARKMARLMGGDIEIEKSSDTGSAFVIKFPLYQGEPLEDIIKMEVVHSSKKPFISSVKIKKSKPTVLVVEDNLINIEVMEMFLDNICKVDNAKDGNTALTKATQKKYDAVIMDINLGTGINGVETTKAIRKIRGYNKVPFVAITGYASVIDREKILTEGIDHYLVKPIDKEELLDLMKKILKIKQS